MKSVQSIGSLKFSMIMVILINMNKWEIVDGFSWTNRWINRPLVVKQGKKRKVFFSSFLPSNCYYFLLFYFCFMFLISMVITSKSDPCEYFQLFCYSVEIYSDEFGNKFIQVKRNIYFFLSPILMIKSLE